MASDGAPELAELYDDETLARIERARAVTDPDRGDEPGGPSSLDPVLAQRARRWLGGAVVAGAMLGLAEVFEGEPDKRTTIEYAPDVDVDDGHPIRFLFVPGDPRASRIVFRPWLVRP